MIVQNLYHANLKIDAAGASGPEAGAETLCRLSPVSRGIRAQVRAAASPRRPAIGRR